MKEHKLEISDNVYGNMIIMCSIYLVVVCFAFVVQKNKIKGGKDLRRNHSKTFPRGIPSYKFYSLTKSFCYKLNVLN